jgi:hypothetical protein
MRAADYRKGRCSSCRKPGRPVWKVRGSQLCRPCGLALQIYENIRAFLGRRPIPAEVRR